MQPDPKQCEEHAASCIKLARVAPTSLTRAQFEDMARAWLERARRLEDLDAPAGSADGKAN